MPSCRKSFAYPRYGPKCRLARRRARILGGGGSALVRSQRAPHPYMMGVTKEWRRSPPFRRRGKSYCRRSCAARSISNPAIRCRSSASGSRGSTLHEYVRRNWAAEVGTEPPDDPGEMIEEYFEEVLESYDIIEQPFSAQQGQR